MSTARTQYSYNQQLLSARVVSTANISGSYVNGNLNNGVGATLTVSSLTTIDGVTLVVGDRVLLVGQTNGNENGIYIVNSVGTNAVLERSDDFQNIEQIKPGQYLTISAGTANAGAVYCVVEPLPALFGVSDIFFVSASAAGSGLYLEAASNLSDVASKITSQGNLGIKKGTTAAYAGGGTSNAFTATGLVATDVVVATILASTNSVSVTKAVPTANTLTITFSADPGAGTTVQWHAIATV